MTYHSAEAARDHYLETEVLTATPQKLRKMLLDASIRFARQTELFWQQDKDDDAQNALERCREIIGELLSSMDPSEEISRKVAGVYNFLLIQFTELELSRDPKQLAEAIAVLEIEQETWRQLCEKMPEAPQGMKPHHGAAKEITATDAGTILTGSPVPETPAGAPPVTPPVEQSGGFSLDA